MKQDENEGKKCMYPKAAFFPFEDANLVLIINQGMDRKAWEQRVWVNHTVYYSNLGHDFFSQKKAQDAGWSSIYQLMKVEFPRAWSLKMKL